MVQPAPSPEQARNAWAHFPCDPNSSGTSRDWFFTRRSLTGAGRLLKTPSQRELIVLIVAANQEGYHCLAIGWSFWLGTLGRSAVGKSGSPSLGGRRIGSFREGETEAVRITEGFKWVSELKRDWINEAINLRLLRGNDSSGEDWDMQKSQCLPAMRLSGRKRHHSRPAGVDTGADQSAHATGRTKSSCPVVGPNPRFPDGLRIETRPCLHRTTDDSPRFY